MTKEQAYELVGGFIKEIVEYNESETVLGNLIDKPEYEMSLQCDTYERINEKNIDILIKALDTIRKGLGIKEDAND